MTNTPTAERTLVDTAESKTPYAGYLYYGLTTYRLPDGTYETSLRTRTYDGVRVADQWATPYVAIEATTDDEAKVAGRAALTAYMKAITGSGE